MVHGDRAARAGELARAAVVFWSAGTKCLRLETPFAIRAHLTRPRAVGGLKAQARRLLRHHDSLIRPNCRALLTNCLALSRLTPNSLPIAARLGSFRYISATRFRRGNARSISPSEMCMKRVYR